MSSTVEINSTNAKQLTTTPTNSTAEQQQAARKQPQPPSPNTAYAMFLHREELSRRKVHFGRASETKIKLTDELITQTKQNIRRCSFEDLETMAREVLFKKNLMRHLHYRRMEVKHMLKAKRKNIACKQLVK